MRKNLGDFNRHKTFLGCKETDKKENQIENLISKKNLCLFNRVKPIHINPINGTFTLIDLSMFDLSCNLDFSWSEFHDYSIILRNVKEIDDHLPKKKVNKTKSKKFRNLCSD